MSYQLILQKAVELHQSGALNQAEQLYRQILQTAPNNADVLNLLGLIAQQKSLHLEATEYFYQAAANAPQHFPIYFNLAVSLGALEKYVEAEEAYKKVIKLKPDCREAYYGLGKIYWAQNKIDDARQAFRSALDISPDYLEAATDLAEISDDVSTLESLATNNPYALYYLGRRAFKQQDFATAQTYLQTADELLADDGIKSLLAETMLAQNDKSAAQKIFYQAYQLNPHNLVALINLADLEAENSAFDTAENFYKKCIELDSHNLRAHLNYANLLLQKKCTVAALEEYRQAAILAPQTPEISYNLALVLKDLKEYEEALDLMFRAFYAKPEQTAWSLNIAETITLFAQDEPQKALKICENWHQQMPENLVASHLWAVLNQQPFTAESAYNKLLFDHFAETYEHTLQNIDYAVINEIAANCSPLSGLILDLGCGTGLAAQKLKTAENRFIGVDISSKMLEIAGQKQLYEELICQDINTYLSGFHPEFSAILAADVFCYFADLAPIFKLCTPARLIFSVETTTETSSFAVQANGRYKHNPEHIKNLLHEARYSGIKTYEICLRTENGNPVTGMLFDCRLA